MPRPFASGVVLKGGTSTMAGRRSGPRQYPRACPGWNTRTRVATGLGTLLGPEGTGESPELQVTTALTGAAPTGVGSSRGVAALRGGW
jgi:hypothetical protein